MIMWCKVLCALCVISGARSLQNGGTYICSPNPWKFNEKFTITFRIDRNVFPSACTGGTTELPMFRMSSNGVDFSSNCSMTDKITDAGVCGSFTPGSIGCGCVSSDDNGFFVIEYNFIASPDYGTTWDATINCPALPTFIQELEFTGTNCTNITVEPTATTDCYFCNFRGECSGEPGYIGCICFIILMILLFIGGSLIFLRLNAVYEWFPGLICECCACFSLLCCVSTCCCLCWVLFWSRRDKKRKKSKDEDDQDSRRPDEEQEMTSNTTRNGVSERTSEQGQDTKPQTPKNGVSGSKPKKKRTSQKTEPDENPSNQSEMNSADHGRYEKKPTTAEDASTGRPLPQPKSESHKMASTPRILPPLRNPMPSVERNSYGEPNKFPNPP